MLYVEKASLVRGFEIASVGPTDAEGSADIALSNGENHKATAAMMRRITLQAGDYLVRKADGSEFLISKTDFEANYTEIKAIEMQQDNEPQAQQQAPEVPQDAQEAQAETHQDHQPQD